MTVEHELADLGDLAAIPQSVEASLAAVQEFLGVEVTWVGSLTPEEYRFERVHGDSESFGFAAGRTMHPAETVCQRVLDGRVPPVLPDVAAEPRVASLPSVREAGMGSFITVPLTFSTGELYGVLCAANHLPDPSLGYRELQFLRIFGRLVADGLEREQLQERAHAAEVQGAALTALLGAAAARDSYGAARGESVVDLAVRVARRLHLDEERVDDVRHVAQLHSVGKLGVPDAVLGKPGPLDDSEWAVVRSHSVRSAEMVALVPGLEHVAPLVRAEPERWDGTGYPDGLTAEEIPLPSRITAVCDAYHAMISDRPYRSALSERHACAELEVNAGSQFCPAATLALLQELEEH